MCHGWPGILRLGWEILCHPICANRWPFFPFPFQLSGKSFANEVDVWRAITDFFAIKKLDFYRRKIAQLERGWQNVLDTNGNYFEDDQSVKICWITFLSNKSKTSRNFWLSCIPYISDVNNDRQDIEKKIKVLRVYTLLYLPVIVSGKVEDSNSSSPWGSSAQTVPHLREEVRVITQRLRRPQKREVPRRLEQYFFGIAEKPTLTLDHRSRSVVTSMHSKILYPNIWSGK